MNERRKTETTNKKNKNKQKQKQEIGDIGERYIGDAGDAEITGETKRRNRR